MHELVKELRALLAERDRVIAKYAKGKRSDRNRLAPLEQIVGAVPEDLIDLYDRFDGAEPPQTIWWELGYFFGNFMFHSAEGLVISNKASRARPNFFLSDEIFLGQGRRAVSLYVAPVGGSYLLVTAMSALSDIRYPAFDSIEGMIKTYIAALRTEVWYFLEDGSTQFDDAGFAELAARYNEYPHYWDAVATNTVDFKIAERERGEIRPRTTPRTGRDMIVHSGFADVVDAVERKER